MHTWGRARGTYFFQGDQARQRAGDQGQGRVPGDRHDLDSRILGELQRDGRLSFSALARRVNLSSPAVAERVRQLEETGVITGYRAQVDPAKAGLPLTVFIEMRCSLGSCLLKTATADELPEIVEVHKLSGSWCSMVKVRVSSMQHLEGLIERIGQHGEMNSHIVLSTPHERTVVEPADPEPRTVTLADGWVTRTPPGADRRT